MHVFCSFRQFKNISCCSLTIWLVLLAVNYTMKHYVIISLLFGCSLSSYSQVPLRTYTYVNKQMTWAGAQQYCRANYDDLATITSSKEMSSPAFAYSQVWIGLHDDPNAWMYNMGNESNSWRWSATGETSPTGYKNWSAGQPNNKDGHETCVVMNPNGQWDDVICAQLNPFVCYNVTNQNQTMYVFIANNFTWNSAQAYCRQYYTDLTTINYSDDNAAVYSAKPQAQLVWIGLYRVSYTWSDNSPSTYRSWYYLSPNNYKFAEFCALMSINNWDDSPCGSAFNFVCERVSKQKTMMRMKIKTDADLTNSVINAQILQQLGAKLSIQGWTGFDLHWNIKPQKIKQETGRTSACNFS
ncbi:macrophage mannose receptor 1-like isoform X1 [Betta splendens]|uniref:Macrophage mannose receptor 1-like isoform X1 n=2 Tax=Betta splendens TaxID=158456 RepID=A0A9W2XB78_BETSP|nr:macrophage mannose receptor 1-like isoform X1 [Betta splendens]